MDVTRTYVLKNESVQTLAYALAEYLDVEKNMITQTMRTRNGYTVQCKGDATAEWTKYLGMDAALSVQLIQNGDELQVSIGTEKWAEKLGIAAVGSIFFQPLLITAGIGALRQAALPQQIYNFIEEYLGEQPIRNVEKTVPVQELNEVVCPHCGTANRVGAVFCKACGAKLEKEEILCPDCGGPLDGDEAFCPYCGKPLKNQ